MSISQSGASDTVVQLDYNIDYYTMGCYIFLNYKGILEFYAVLYQTPHMGSMWLY